MSDMIIGKRVISPIVLDPAEASANSPHEIQACSTSKAQQRVRLDLDEAFERLQHPNRLNARLSALPLKRSWDEMSPEQIIRELTILLFIVEHEFAQNSKEYTNLISKVSKQATDRLVESFNSWKVVTAQLAAAAVNFGGGLMCVGVPVEQPVRYLANQAATNVFDPAGRAGRALREIDAGMGALAQQAQTNQQLFSTGVQLLSQGVGAPAAIYQQQAAALQAKEQALQAAANQMVQTHSQDDGQAKQRSQELMQAIRQLNDQVNQLYTTISRG